MCHTKYPTATDIAEMRARGYTVKTISEAESLLPRTLMRDDLITRIRTAFHGVSLGNGVGLVEGQALDDYDDAETCAAIRARDEKEDWTKFGPQLLRECQSSLSFCDAEGMRFHLPAFLIQGLLEEIDPPIFDLTYKPGENAERFSLLSPEQRAIVRDYLRFIIDDPDEDDEDLRAAIEGCWSE